MNQILSIMEIREDGSRNSLSFSEQRRAIDELIQVYGNRTFNCETVIVEITNDFNMLIRAEIAFGRNNDGFEPEFPLFEDVV